IVGLTDDEQFQTPSLQKCVHTWEAASNTKVVAPKDLKAGPNGKRDEVWITVRDACSDLYFFKTIADRIGQYLNNDNWVDAVNHFGSIDIIATTKADLTTGKYDADDSGSLSSFDSTIGTSGDWKKI